MLEAINYIFQYENYLHNDLIKRAIQSEIFIK
jgi:hypothetical protein